MNTCTCEYCGKDVKPENVVDLHFYLIGDLACKRCAKIRLKEIVNDVIPTLEKELNIKIT